MKVSGTVVFVAIILAASPAFGHKLGVAEFRMIELESNHYAVRYDIPLGEAGVYLPPNLPAHCEWVDGPDDREGAVRFVFRSEGRSLASGDTLILPWRRNGVLVTVFWRNGTTARQFFPPGEEGIPVRMDELGAGSGTWARAAGRYFVLGLRHILQGIDHLFFVAGLLLLVSGWRQLLWTVTAFTVAHSLTLALSVFGFLRISPDTVDVLVALSIVFLAREILGLRRGRTTLASGKPWLVSFGFGLVHGLGFAGALEQLGLPNESIPVALLFFNLGVEGGQLLFVGIWLTVLAACRQLSIGGPRLRGLRIAAVYLLGIAATLWFIHRLAPAFAT